MNSLDIDLKSSLSRWPLRTKLARGTWEACRFFFWPSRFRIFSPVRVMLLRLFGAAIDGPVLVMDGVRIWMPWNLRLGKYSTIGSGCEIYNFGYVSIGENTVVSQRCFVCTATHDHSRRDMPLIWSPITIGDGVWVAAEAFIGPGVSIGEGSVVAARATVVKDVPPRMIVAGSPARVVKERIIVQ